MGMPLILPDPLWLARLWPVQDSALDLSVLHTDKHPQVHPYLKYVDKQFEDMAYWVLYFEDMWLLPGVSTFKSIPDLIWRLHRGELDFRGASNLIATENLRARAEVVPFWVDLVHRLTSSSGPSSA